MDPITRLLLMLDEVMDRLMIEPTDKDRGEAVGLAKAINVISFLELDQVREYAQHRWDARQEGLEALDPLEWAGLR